MDRPALFRNPWSHWAQPGQDTGPLHLWNGLPWKALSFKWETCLGEQTRDPPWWFSTKWQKTMAKGHARSRAPHLPGTPAPELPTGPWGSGSQDGRAMHAVGTGAQTY